MKNSAPADVRGCGEQLSVRVGMTIQAVEKVLIAATLEHTDGNMSKAAAILGTDGPRYLHRPLHVQEGFGRIQPPRKSEGKRSWGFKIQRGITGPEMAKTTVRKLRIRWWPGTESNRRRQPFQGCAPPALAVDTHRSC